MAERAASGGGRAQPPCWAALAGWLALVLLIAWFWHSPVFFPLRILVVLFHECGHGLAAVLTGGEVLEIGLSANEGGTCLTRGGWSFVVLNAGYLGSLVCGLLLLALSRGRRAPRGLVLALGALVLSVTVLLLRPLLSFGFLYGALAGGALLALGLWAPPWINWILLRLVGSFSVLYALLDIRDDVFAARPGSLSDASALAAMTGIPAVLWGVVWGLVALGLLVGLRRRLL